MAQFKELLETNSYLSMGRYGEEFEQAFAEYVGAKYAVAVSSGTAALEIIFRCLGVEGKEVIVPTNTFAATAFAVIHAGGRPVFADCMEDMTLDPSDAENRVTRRTAGIVSVHIGGMVSPATAELVDLADRRGIPLIEDAAHAHGSRLNQRHAGTFGVAGAFSFFSTKVMTTGEGGMIVSNDRNIYEKALLLRDQAKLDGRNYHRGVGYNWRMTEFQALLGLSQLRTLDDSLKRRGEIAQIYDKGCDEHPDLTALSIPESVRHSYYKYILFLENGNREQISAEIKEEYGISLGGRVYDVPCHLQPAFASYGNVSLPVAEDLCRRHICPPIYSTMTDVEARYVVESLQRIVR
jgi:dTDP-4-amino-4,6-dideoxygalactose transaminase